MTRRRIITLVIMVIAVGALITLTVVFLNNFRGIVPLIRKPSVDISEVIPESGETREDGSSSESGEEQVDADSQDEDPEDTGLLKLDTGFRISILSSEVPVARVLAVDDQGNIWVSQTGIGKISVIRMEEGRPVSQDIIFEDLKNPHGLAFDPAVSNTLYIAEEDRISRAVLDSNGFPVGDLEKLIDLPGGGRHYTRPLGFDGGGRLYVSIGSTCDVCNEADERIASIYSLEKDGSGFSKFASGLRNSVFFRWHPLTGDMWATEMGRDNLGDNLPPDEINIILEGRDYGWPYCYGKNIQDLDFNSSDDAAARCLDSEPSYIDIQAHSAPLGLDFIPAGGGWPSDYKHDLLVSYHGSWNRSIPTGYKVVRYILDSQGNYIGEEDFISGWLADDGSVLGRPVDILVLPEGAAYISDDRAGIIYKVEYMG